MDNSESKGSLIGSIIVIVLLIIGAVYLFTNRDNDNQPSETATSTTEATMDETTAELTNVSDSDEVSDLEQDAAATDLSNLDQESAIIEAELNQ